MMERFAETGARLPSSNQTVGIRTKSGRHWIVLARRVRDATLGRRLAAGIAS
jgi:hypothetical protein